MSTGRRKRRCNPMRSHRRRAISLTPLTRGGPKRWPEILKTMPEIGSDDGPLAVDVLTLPDNNPWHCQMRISGFDFLPDGQSRRRLHLGRRRLAGRRTRSTGRGPHMATHRFGAVSAPGPQDRRRAESLSAAATRSSASAIDNGDGETDFYECFNSDHQVTEHFHEFAMGLQTDADGNFYYAKAARHGLPALVPHHGTLLKVSKDGTTHRDPGDRLSRAQRRLPEPRRHFFPLRPGGILDAEKPHQLGQDRGASTATCGAIMTSQTHPTARWSPPSAGSPTPWIAHRRNCSGLTVRRPAWQPLRGALLSLSYGNGKIFVVPHEIVGGQMQGGVCALPIPASPTGIMRGRFNPVDGHLYTCGLFGWAGDRTQPGGFYRVRMTGKPLFVPVGLTRAGRAAWRSRSQARLSGNLSKNPPISRPKLGQSSVQPTTAPITSTNARHGSPLQGSPRMARTVTLEIPELKPTWCMEIRYAIKAASGEPVDGVIHNTIHHLSD